MIKKFNLFINESLKDKLKGKSYDDIVDNIINKLSTNKSVDISKKFNFETGIFNGWESKISKSYIDDIFNKFNQNGIYLMIYDIDNIPFKNIYNYKILEKDYKIIIKYDVPKKYFKNFIKQLLIKLIDNNIYKLHIKIIGNYFNN